MNPRLITRLPWFELSILLILGVVGWAVYRLFEIRQENRQYYSRVEQLTEDWQQKESENFRDENNQMREAIQKVQTEFAGQQRELNDTQMTNDLTLSDAYTIHEEYLSIASRLESNIRSMHNSLSNFVMRASSAEQPRADLRQFQLRTNAVASWIARQKERSDMERFSAKSRKLKGRINGEQGSATNRLPAITYDLGSLMDEVEKLFTNYLSDARFMTENLGKPITGPAVTPRLQSAGLKAGQLLDLAQHARRNSKAVRAFLEPEWQAETQQRRKNLELEIVRAQTRLDVLMDTHEQKHAEIAATLPKPPSSAYLSAFYPLLVAQIGLGLFFLVALYRRLVVERLRYKLYESTSESKLANLVQLAAWLAHEIKQPLTAINAWLWTLEKRVTEDMPEHMGTTAIRKEIHRLDQIVKDFLRFTQPAAPKLVPMKAEPVLREVLELVGPELERRGIRLSLDSRVEASFSADPQQLKQVLINLITNAAESIQTEGTITVRARRDHAPLNGRPADAILIEVEDTGSGIPPEVQQRLFDPFFSTKDEGTGLGLPIARKVIDAHGGALEFKTALGEGTTFRIVLPMVREPAIKV